MDHSAPVSGGDLSRLRTPAVAGVDPSQVNTVAELAACLDGLRRRRGLSYEAMQKAAAKLRHQPGGPRWDPLGKSTVGEIVTGTRLPTAGKLRTFLAVCEVSGADIAQWIAAWERAGTADLTRPVGAVRVREARARQLGVHAAIQIDSSPDKLPAYVPRDLDHRLRVDLAVGSEHGCFLLLVGGSSVGKTRTLYEAVLATLPEWWLVHPADSDSVRALATRPTPRTLVWLDEFQRYLGADNGVTAGTVRTLLRDGTVLVATMWPDEYGTRTLPPRFGERDPYAADRELLNLSQVYDVADALTRDEQFRAAEIAVTDRRIRTALETRDAGLTQVLAAGPDLVRRWEQAPSPYARALITAAVDARRLGVHAPLTPRILAAAVPGYLTPSQRARAPGNWLETALDYATAELHGAASTLSPVATSMGHVAGYAAADFLLQRGRQTRRTSCPPRSVWQALVAHIRRPDDIERLAHSAYKRMRYRYAEPLYKRLADAGEWNAASPLVDLLATQGRIDDAVEILDGCAAAGDGAAADRLAKLLAEHGRIDDLRMRADAGEWNAANRLAELLAEHECVDDLRIRADAGDGFAADRLADLLAERGCVDELRVRADAGQWNAANRLADLLAEHGCVDELRARADGGDQFAASVLAEEGHEYAGDWCAASWLADLLAERRRVDELRVRADTGDRFAAERLAGLLGRHGHVPEGAAASPNRSGAAARRRSRWLAELLARRGRFDDVMKDFWTRADAGDELAARRLVELLVGRGRVDDAIGILWTQAEADDGFHPTWLAELLAKLGKVERATEILRIRANNRDRSAAQRLARVLATQGRLDELRARSDMGDAFAAEMLVDVLVRRGHIRELRLEVDAGTSFAADRLVAYLAGTDEAGLIDADRMRRCGLDADGSIFRGGRSAQRQRR